jgi:hypothetical protein
MIKKSSHLVFIVFALALLWKDIAAFSWNVNFYLNQKSLAKTFCENKDKPEMKCNGKCYLAKKLKQIAQEEQEERQNKLVPPLKLKDSEWFSSLANHVFSLPTIIFHIEEQKPQVLPNQQLAAGYISNCFHPPSCNC